VQRDEERKRVERARFQDIRFVSLSAQYVSLMIAKRKKEEGRERERGGGGRKGEGRGKKKKIIIYCALGISRIKALNNDSNVKLQEIR